LAADATAVTRAAGVDGVDGAVVRLRALAARGAGAGDAAAAVARDGVRLRGALAALFLADAGASAAGGNDLARESGDGCA
jgi:hypothetical protein